jgi:hypothetical protein
LLSSQAYTSLWIAVVHCIIQTTSTYILPALKVNLTQIVDLIVFEPAAREENITSLLRNAMILEILEKSTFVCDTMEFDTLSSFLEEFEQFFIHLTDCILKESSHEEQRMQAGLLMLCLRLLINMTTNHTNLISYFVQPRFLQSIINLFIWCQSESQHAIFENGVEKLRSKICNKKLNTAHATRTTSMDVIWNEQATARGDPLLVLIGLCVNLCEHSPDAAQYFAGASENAVQASAFSTHLLDYIQSLELDQSHADIRKDTPAHVLGAVLASMLLHQMQPKVIHIVQRQYTKQVFSSLSALIERFICLQNESLDHSPSSFTGIEKKQQIGYYNTLFSFTKQLEDS